MSDLQWFDNPRFRTLCKENKIEPMITGERILVLVCPRAPDESVKHELTELIPASQRWELVEGMSKQITAAICAMLGFFGVEGGVFQVCQNHEVVLHIENRPNNTVTQPGSPLWDEIGKALKADEFVESYKIVVEGELYRDSDGYSKPDDPTTTESSTEELLEEGPVQDPTKHRSVKVPEIKDHRFDFNREFLPVDAATDIKILLESTGSIDEFLKNI